MYIHTYIHAYTRHNWETRTNLYLYFVYHFSIWYENTCNYSTISSIFPVNRPGAPQNFAIAWRPCRYYQYI